MIGQIEWIPDRRGAAVEWDTELPLAHAKNPFTLGSFSPADNG